MANEIRTVDALKSLKPSAEWVLRGEKLEWLGSKEAEFTQAEIDAEVVRLQAEYDTQEYARNRAAEYPSTGDQLDYIFHNGIAKWKIDMIEPVKTKYPKPS